MKLVSLHRWILAGLLFAGSQAAVFGQETQEPDDRPSLEPGRPKQKELPKPKATGPFMEGDLMVPNGHYIQLEDGTAINVRVVGMRFQVFFLDEEGLVMEPPFVAGNIRLINATTGRRLFMLNPLPGEAGLGSAQRRQPPFNFQVVLTLTNDAEWKETSSWVFRMTRAGAREPDWALPEGAPEADEG